MALPKAVRPVFMIANDIRKAWPNVYFGAVPYLDALSALSSSVENYGMDSGKSIAAYFLANAKGFRGPAAKALKAELKEVYGLK